MDADNGGGLRHALGLMHRFYREYVRPEKGAFFAIQFLHIIFAAALVLPPLLVQLLIDEALPTRNLPLVVALAVGTWAIYALVAAVGKVRSYWGHAVAQRITYTLRNHLYSHLQKLSFRFYDNTKVGELISRLIDDLNSVQEVVYHGPENLVTNCFSIMFVGGMVFFLNWKLAFVCCGIMLLIAVINYALARRMFRGARKVREQKAALASRTEDNLAGMRIIQAFVREPFEMGRFETENRQHYDSRLSVIRPMSSIFPVSLFILGLAMAIVVGYGGFHVIEGHMRAGALVAFLMYMRRFMWPLLSLAMISESATRFLAGIERFFLYMDMDPDIKDAPETVDLKEARGDVEFRNVSFSYDNEPVLRDINIKVRAGETIALVGPSGAGKTTITRLIPRFYEPQGGEILLDGHDIRNIKLSSLRRNIGIVMQDDYLFNDTLLNNIAYGRLDAAEEEVVEAARQGNVDQFARALPEGYQTEVGQRGTKLSEGQAQRVSIARAILKDAPIFILDEATSSVDSQTEKLIQEALDRLIRDRTCFIIAHRLSTIINSDRILFIEDGRVVEEGTHRQLLEHDGRYATYYNLQFAAASQVG